MKRIHVVAGVIVSKDQHILIAKRPAKLHQGGKWEFPGGKVEEDEEASQALIRELMEEVNLEVSNTLPMMKISHDYPDKQVLLDIHWVKEYSGEAKGLEGQDIAWVTKEELAHYEFPDANIPIIDALMLEL